jgi:hypothetical protein
MTRFLVRNAGRIGAIDPMLKELPFNDQLDRLRHALDSDYRGDASKFFKDLESDEFDLRLKGSIQASRILCPEVAYAPPPSYAMDGYETTRRKHAEQIRRCFTSARDPPSNAGGSPLPNYNRTKGTIANYGNFAGWAKYRQLNATAMLDR